MLLYATASSEITILGKAMKRPINKTLADITYVRN
jgi:hypothetical protein